MSTIDFVVRTGAGGIDRGVVASGNEQTIIDGGAGREISLNLTQQDLRGYFRDGDKLIVTLADGRIVVIDDYFASNGVPQTRLFLSADGALNEVTFDSAENGVLFANYGPTEAWGKWSPDDDLIFLDRPEVISAELAGEGDNVSMLAAGLLGGGGVSRLLAGGAAAGLAAAALAGGEGGGNGGGSSNPDEPVAPTLEAPTGAVAIGGDGSEPDQTVTVTGTGEPGSDVTIKIGDKTVDTTVDEDGTWTGTFEDETFPDDGTYDIDVIVTDPTGVEHELDGPTVTIDTTPPEIDFNDGVASIDDITNADDYSDGVEVSGTGEAGSTVEVTANDVTHTTTVAEDGTWSVVFTPGELPEGEITVPAVIVTTDSFGNSTTVNDAFVIDTIPHPITIDWQSVGGEGVVNASENGAGFAVTGTSTAGATLTVTVDGYSGSVTVGDDGTWSLDVPANELPGGEYDVTVTATTTDAAGNASSVTETFRVDTVNMVTITADAIEGDNIVNASEASDGFTMTGTTQVGATVMVTMGTVTLPATVNADGTWSVDFSASDLAPGEYDAEITVVSTDAAGNSATAMRTIHVDTVTNVSLDTTLAGDNMVNASEAGMGVPVTGTSQPGNSIEMSFNGTSYTGVAGADGTWTIVVPSSGITPGTYTAPITVIATDAAGNSATAAGTLDIDTEADVTVATATVEGDGVVNMVEQSDGVILTGTSQPGSTVDVTVAGTTHAATVDAGGNWTVTFSASEFPVGETTATVTAVATDAAGNSATATGDVNVDTFVRNHAITSTTGGADGVINAEEAASGMTLSGTTEPGSTVVVAFSGVTVNATVSANGTWTAEFPASAIPAGEYTADATATATDPAGNVDVATQSVTVDTVAGILEISAAPVEIDDVVNFVEASDGVTIVGTSDPGASVVVSLAGVERTVMTDGSGNWAANFAASEVAQGTYVADITATRTDPAGNVIVRTDSVNVDTQVDNFVIASDPIEVDDVINAVEASDGVTMTGTVEVGSTVSVEFGGVIQPATVDAAGNWSVTFAPGDIADGEYVGTATVNATDAAGNVASLTRDVTVDTLVNELEANGPVTSDDVVNNAEAAAGVALSGTVEAGSTVNVTFEGTTLAASVDAAGNWSVIVPDSAIPHGEYTANVLIDATDAAGNTAQITQAVSVDTTAPDATRITTYTEDFAGNVLGISVEASDDTQDVFQVGADGSINAIDHTQVDIAALGRTSMFFDNSVPDGSHLVVTAEDDAGNTSGTYLVLDETGNQMVNVANPNLPASQIEAIDLQFADESELTITEDQLLALSDNSNTLTVYGGADDTVTIAGATHVGQVSEGGQTFNVYDLGDGTVRIEEDITNVVI